MRPAPQRSLLFDLKRRTSRARRDGGRPRRRESRRRKRRVNTAEIADTPRIASIRRAFALEWLALLWMTGEATVATTHASVATSCGHFIKRSHPSATGCVRERLQSSHGECNSSSPSLNRTSVITWGNHEPAKRTRVVAVHNDSANGTSRPSPKTEGSNRDILMTAQIGDRGALSSEVAYGGHYGMVPSAVASIARSWARAFNDAIVKVTRRPTFPQIILQERAALRARRRRVARAGCKLSVRCENRSGQDQPERHNSFLHRARGRAIGQCDCELLEQSEHAIGTTRSATSDESHAPLVADEDISTQAFQRVMVRPPATISAPPTTIAAAGRMPKITKLTS